MPRINPRRADVKAIYEKFAGVGATPNKTELPVRLLRNFRILPNGWLEKRSGWKKILELSKPVRGIFASRVMEYSLYFLFCDDCCYYYLENFDELVEIPIEGRNSASPITPFYYHECLYFLDGNDIFYYDGKKFAPAKGYAPLVGIGWDPQNGGEVFEHYNLISDRARVNYLTPNGEKEIKLPLFATSVDRVFVDGAEILDFSFTPYTRDLKLDIETGGSRVDVAFTFLRSDEHRYIRSSTVAFVDSFGGQDRLLLSGCETAFESFLARPLPDLMESGNLASYPDGDALYISRDSIMTIGDLLHSVNTFYCDHDRILAFTDNQIYASIPTTESGGVEYYTLLQGMGCSAKMMNLRVGGDPLILNTSGLFKLRITVGSRPQLDFERISCPYPELMDEEIIRRLIFVQNDANDEVWFRDRLDPAGRVLVYNYRRDCWYEFDNVRASAFLQFGGHVYFGSEDGLCCFEPDLTTDGDLPFEAVCQSDFIDFDDPERQKRSLRMALATESGGNIVNVRLETEHRIRNFEFVGKLGAAPDFFDVRAAMGRFRHLSVTLYDQEPARSRWRRLALFANL